MGMRGACPGETVTYTCSVTQGFLLEWIVEPFLPTTARIQFTSTAPIGSRLDCNAVASVRCEDFQFVATLTATVNPNIVMSTTLADMTSTLAFSATSRLNGTVVLCRGSTAAGFPIVNHSLSVAGTSMLFWSFAVFFLVAFSHYIMTPGLAICELAFNICRFEQYMPLSKL